MKAITLFRLRETIAGATALAGLIALSAHCAACSPDARRALVETIIDGASCALAHQHLPDADIIKVCSLKAVDVERILRLVSQSRDKAAAARAEALAGSALCADAGPR